MDAILSSYSEENFIDFDSSLTTFRLLCSILKIVVRAPEIQIRIYDKSSQLGFK